MNTLRLPALLAASTLLWLPCAQGADVAAGKATAEETCIDCHGDDGKGDDKTPDITPGSLSTAEFLQAMQDYRSGKRSKDAKMARAAKKLAPVDVENVAAYFATLK
jgi:cytochrome c553